MTARPTSCTTSCTPDRKCLLALIASLLQASHMVPLHSQVTRYTSALTLQVLGNAKGVFTTALSIFIFRNPFTVTSVGGYLITVAVRLWKVPSSRRPLHCMLVGTCPPTSATARRIAVLSAGRGLLCSGQAVSDCTEDKPHQHTRLNRCCSCQLCPTGLSVGWSAIHLWAGAIASGVEANMTCAQTTWQSMPFNTLNVTVDKHLALVGQVRQLLMW